MCLLLPGRVVEVRDEPDGGRSATVQYADSRRTASLLFLPEVSVGDLVLVQAGYAMRRLTEAQAREAVEAMERAARAVAVVPAPGEALVPTPARTSSASTAPRSGSAGAA